MAFSDRSPSLLVEALAGNGTSLLASRTVTRPGLNPTTGGSFVPAQWSAELLTFTPTGANPFVRITDTTTPSAASDAQLDNVAVAAVPVFNATQILGARNSGVVDDGPALSGDGLTLYFSSTRSGVHWDVWLATRATRQSSFGAPSLVAGINSGAFDAHAAVAADGLSIYLDSTRGPSGIYLATAPTLHPASARKWRCRASTRRRRHPWRSRPTRCARSRSATPPRTTSSTS
jgi:hypothetical protein